jgi:hypothetical protein
VPTYQSTEPDWDEEVQWVDIEEPYVPSFLGWLAVILIGSLISSAAALGLKRGEHRRSTERGGSRSLAWL